MWMGNNGRKIWNVMEMSEYVITPRAVWDDANEIYVTVIVSLRYAASVACATNVSSDPRAGNDSVVK